MPNKSLTSCEYASILWPYHLSLSSNHRLSEPLETMASKFMLGDRDNNAFNEWSTVMYEDCWQLVDPIKSRLKVISLPKRGSRGQLINCERMILDSYRWSSEDCQSYGPFDISKYTPRSDPIFVSCVWDFSNILEARVTVDPTSINRESDSPRLESTLEKAWWNAAEPVNRVRALDLACLYENYDCAKILLEAGAEATNHLALSFGIRA